MARLKPCPDTCFHGGYEVAAVAEFRNGATNIVESHLRKRAKNGDPLYCELKKYEERRATKPIYPMHIFT